MKSENALEAEHAYHLVHIFQCSKALILCILECKMASFGKNCMIFEIVSFSQFWKISLDNQPCMQTMEAAKWRKISITVIYRIKKTEVARRYSLVLLLVCPCAYLGLKLRAGEITKGLTFWGAKKIIRCLKLSAFKFFGGSEKLAITQLWHWH